MNRITEKKENGFYELTTGNEIYGEENGIRLVQIVGRLEDIEDQLGCTLEELFNGLMTKQASLRYFDKYDAKNNHCEVGWYVNMIMYGWVTLQDFINGLKGKSD